MTNSQLDSQGESHPLVVVVKDGIVLAHENVTHDPKRLGRDINTNHSEQADEARVDDVVSTFKSVVLATHGHGNVGQAGDLVARDSVLLLVEEEGLGTNSLSEGLNIGNGAGEKGGSGVNDGTVGSGGVLAGHGEAFELNSPVGLVAERDIADFASVLGGVHTANQQFTHLTIGLSEGEREQVVGELVLADEGVHNGLSMINRDGGPCETEDSVKFANAIGQSETRDISDLSKGLGINGEVAHGNSVGGEKSRDWSTSVLDVEDGAVLHVAGALGVVVLGVAAAVFALGGWHPKVGATSIKDHVEGLGRGSDGNGSVVLGILCKEGKKKSVTVRR